MRELRQRVREMVKYIEELMTSAFLRDNGNRQLLKRLVCSKEHPFPYSATLLTRPYRAFIKSKRTIQKIGVQFGSHIRLKQTVVHLTQQSEI